ncbi:MAG: terminase family protein, partial [Pseudomonadota bacterium]|nr:terminase family protein [Pseudomonadota bacterium]
MPKKPTPPPDRSGLRRQFAAALKTDWSRLARQNQLPPPGDWRIWLLLAGRGFGKTRTIVEFVRAEVEAGRACRIALLAATASDCRDVLVTGHSGILNVFPEPSRPIYEPTKRLLSWKNGAIATMYSADEPDRLRGPQFDLAICDELAAWRYPEALDMLLLGLRIGKNPRVAIATTPRPTKVIRDLLAREGRDVAVTRGSTLDNRQNLAPAYVEQIIERYKGTRLERQEIHGEVLEDTPGALWNRDTLEQTRVEAAPKDLQRIVVAIDPAGSSEEGADETGIVVAGIGQDGHAYVLEDISGRYDPTGWARRALGAFHVWKADRIVCETNYGGEMVRATIEAVDPTVPVKPITSSRGKVLRAEPIAAFFEQRKAHIVGSLPELEDQACRFTADWTRSRDGSPDRVDAMVFALSDLMLGLPAGGFFKEAMFLNDSQPVVLTRRPLAVFAVLGTPHDTQPGSDSVAVLYLAKSSRPDAALTILDWSIATHETALLRGAWLEDVARNLGGWAAATQTTSAGIWLERSTPAGGALAELGVAHRLQIMDATDALKQLPVTLPERVALAAKYIGTGALVRIGAEAHAKAVTFRGLTRN